MRSSSTTHTAARSLRLVRIAAGVAGLLLIAAALLGAGSGVLFALPVIVLMTVLLSRRYPGLETLVRYATRLRRRPVRAARASRPARGFGALEPRALRLLAGSRILRGPPSALPAGR